MLEAKEWNFDNEITFFEKYIPFLSLSPIFVQIGSR
jgi:hypothetical protein